MRHLFSKCGTPVRLCADPTDVYVVFHAGLARQRRKTLALRLFPLDTCLPRVLHTEDAPRAGQRTAQCRLVIEIAPLVAILWGVVFVSVRSAFTGIFQARVETKTSEVRRQARVISPA